MPWVTTTPRPPSASCAASRAISSAAAASSWTLGRVSRVRARRSATRPATAPPRSARPRRAQAPRRPTRARHRDRAARGEHRDCSPGRRHRASLPGSPVVHRLRRGAGPRGVRRRRRVCARVRSRGLLGGLGCRPRSTRRRRLDHAISGGRLQTTPARLRAAGAGRPPGLDGARVRPRAPDSLPTPIRGAAGYVHECVTTRSHRPHALMGLALLPSRGVGPRRPQPRGGAAARRAGT